MCCFEKLSVLTDGLSGEKQVTISALLPILKHIHNTLLCVSSSDSPLARNMKEVIHHDLASRYNSPKLVALLDKSFLDPRFRDKYLNQKQTTLSSLSDECLPLCNESAEPLSQNCETDQPHPQKPRKGLGALLAKISECDTGLSSDYSLLTPEARVHTEITTYLVSLQWI